MTRFLTFYPCWSNLLIYIDHWGIFLQTRLKSIHQNPGHDQWTNKSPSIGQCRKGTNCISNTAKICQQWKSKTCFKYFYWSFLVLLELISLFVLCFWTTKTGLGYRGSNMHRQVVLPASHFLLKKKDARLPLNYMRNCKSFLKSSLKGPTLTSIGHRFFHFRYRGWPRWNIKHWWSRWRYSRRPIIILLWFWIRSKERCLHDLHPVGTHP